MPSALIFFNAALNHPFGIYLGFTTITISNWIISYRTCPKISRIYLCAFPHSICRKCWEVQYLYTIYQVMCLNIGWNSNQCRPWSDCSLRQFDLGLHCLLGMSDYVRYPGVWQPSRNTWKDMIIIAIGFTITFDLKLLWLKIRNTKCFIES